MPIGSSVKHVVARSLVTVVRTSRVPTFSSGDCGAGQHGAAGVGDAADDVGGRLRERRRRETPSHLKTGEPREVKAREDDAWLNSLPFVETRLRGTERLASSGARMEESSRNNDGGERCAPADCVSDGRHTSHGESRLQGERNCFRSANASPTRSASEDVFACAMFDVTAMTMPLSRPVISDITMPPASSPLTLPGFVASAKRTRSDGVE